MTQGLLNLAERLKQTRGILWDFDGCVVDSEPWHWRAYQAAFQPYGHVIPETIYYERFSHKGYAADDEIAKAGLSCTGDQIRAVKSEHYAAFMERGLVTPFSDVPEILSLLARLGIKSLVASNSPREQIEALLKRHKLLGQFSAVIGADSLLRKKPFPDVFQKGLELLGMAPHDVLIFEDSERGFKAAQAAHMSVVWLRTPRNMGFSSALPYFAEVQHHELVQILKNQVDVKR